MAIDVSRGLYYTDGSIVRHNVVVITAGFNADPDVDASRVVFRLEDGWHQFDVETDAVVSVTCADPDCFIVGSGGLVMSVPFQRGTPLERMADQIRMWVLDDAQEFGEITRVRMIAQRPYCCGQSGQVYRLRNEEWERADAGLRSDNAPDFEDLAGTSETDIYAVGVDGAVFHFGGRRWDPVSVPTNRHLSNVRCTAQGLFYISGDDGTILSGADSSWSLITEPDIGKHYWGMEVFNGTLYLAHSGGIELLAADGLIPAEINLGEIYPSIVFMDTIPSSGHSGLTTFFSSRTVRGNAWTYRCYLNN